MSESGSGPDGRGDVLDEERIDAIVGSLRSSFAWGRTRPLDWRGAQLTALRSMLTERRGELHRALRKDLGRCEQEAWLGETGLLLAEIDHASKNLRRWNRPKRVSAPLFHRPGRGRIRREPLGVALVIGPWNYPVQLTLAPLVGAIAAGNCALLKPSEIAPSCAEFLARRVPEHLDPECFAVVTGGAERARSLLTRRFDHIFYTGGAAVAREVARAAAERLTPLTLELGGKSPAIVDADVDLEVAARRVAWGKLFNAGQSCVAPDHALVHREVADAFVELLGATIREFYGQDPQRSPDYARIVSDRHFERLLGHLESGRVAHGGRSDPRERYIEPTILVDVPDDAPAMQEEIFGPILPVAVVPDMPGAVDRVNARPEPLAIYVFSKNRGTVREVLDNTVSGGAAVNDTMVQLSLPALPFGGVGASGSGTYHGRAGFETFSHPRSVLYKSTAPDPSLRYPPYTARKLKWLRRLLPGAGR